MAYSSDLFDCSICLETLVEPVTAACGHSFCMKCINDYWDVRSNRRAHYSCPQCRTTFNTRPVLQRNTVLANLLEEQKKKTSQSAADGDDDAFAAPGDVNCDVCKGRKRKAHMFCFMCLASYCETHLQPHFEVPALKKHYLIQASTRVKENICSCHDRRLEIYCRTDQQFLCPLCVVEHKSHDIVAVKTEMEATQRKVEKARQEVTDRVLAAESKMTELKDAADAIRAAAWEACDDYERKCDEHIRLYISSVERKCLEMRQKVGELEKDGVDWTKRHLGPLERDIYKLRGMETKLRQLSLIEDPTEFLQGFEALNGLPVFTDSQEGLNSPAEFVSAQNEKLKNMCDKEKKELLVDSERTAIDFNPKFEVDYREITSRKDISSEYTALKVDPCTVQACLYLSNTKTEISWGNSDQGHPDHPDRFTNFYQALCKKGLTRNCYWEVEWDGGIVEVAVSYKRIKRKGSGKESCFGHNKESWKLTCSHSACTFWHNNLHKGQIPPARCRRVGVHLEYREGKLSFYSVLGPDRLTLLHQIQTTFTEPLYPGFSVDLGATLTMCTISSDNFN
ncbi:E3 ubiquitin/ISG15 ligase TRIM25-like [Odontesthes bonariensis]|uniref:E3 ubiquitin/ISG15 ligase TRIM25-like n=1 Tax=Odontesthes bonariensis TaxID=219752 RepID=UPI003F581CF4